jgi:hypothetical protein
VPLDLRVEIYVDGSWIDITWAVYQRVDVQITRGRSSEAGRADPSRATMQINNRDGQFSPRNPTSWLYGKIGRNTQVRISIGADVRFSGEISEWPAKWDTTGRDVYTSIEASGVLRRLTQGASPLKSTLYRGLTSLANPPKAYWPCEDGERATQIASAVGGPPMLLRGTPSFGQYTGFKCSEPLPNLNNSWWTGTVPTYPATGNIQVWWIQFFPSGAATAGQDIITVYTTGTAYSWKLIWEDVNGAIRIQAGDSTGTLLLNSVIGFVLANKKVRIGLQLIQNGANIDWSIDTLVVGDGFATGTGATLNAQTVGRATSVRVNGGNDLGVDLAIGHIAVHDEILGLFNLAGELNAFTTYGAHPGEAAGRRIQRLCREEGIGFRGVGNLDATAPMGAQLPDELATILTDAADADGGILYEPRDIFGLAYRTRESLYNQTAGLALDYSAAHLSGIEPVDDDQQTRNDITVTRTDGSSARTVQETGVLSVLAPPSGVGRYDQAVTLNLEADPQIGDAAGWLLHLGTVDEARYPVLSVDLTRAPFVADSVLAAAVQRLDAGDRLTVANPPAWLPPDAISQLAQGFVETMNAFVHRVDVNCTPESPWGQTARYNDGVSRYSSDASTLQAGVSSSATSLQVATTGVRLWSHADGDFDIRVGGEVMTVTAISGTSSPQTFTVVRSVNTVVKAHSSGEAVALDHPRVYVR